jgi:hypothetical protein
MRCFMGFLSTFRKIPEQHYLELGHYRLDISPKITI